MRVQLATRLVSIYVLSINSLSKKMQSAKSQKSTLQTISNLLAVFVFVEHAIWMDNLSVM